MRAVSQPSDHTEREAERAAEAAADGRRVPSWSLRSIPLHSPVQRQEAGAGEKSDEEKKTEAAKKVGEALLETEAGKTLKKKVIEHPTVQEIKDAATSPVGLGVGGAALVGGVTALALTGKELPIQPPEIPLDRITPGLSGKVTYTGPVNAPTFVGLTITYKEQGPKSTGPKQTATEKLREENARLAIEQAAFRRGLRYPPGSKEAEEQRLIQEAIAKIVSRGTTELGIPGLVVPLTEPGKKREDLPVQRSSASTPPNHITEARVDAALSQPGRPLAGRTRHQMEARFGYDFSAVRIHDDAASATIAGSLDAAAFTVGSDIVFGAGRFDPHSARGAHLLAHELAHVVQQGEVSLASRGIHRYTTFSSSQQSTGASRGWVHPDDEALRVADDGQMAVEDKGWGEGTNKRAWTKPKLIADANVTLARQGSRANLRAKPGGREISGGAPGSVADTSLVEIEPFKPSGGEFDVASDCGTAARQVMGSEQPASGGVLGGVIGGGIGLLAGAGIGAGLGLLAGGPLGAAVGAIIGGIAGLVGGILKGKAIGERPGRDERDVAALSGAGTDAERYLTPRPYHGGSPTTPEEWSEELFKKEFGEHLTRSEAYARYAALSPADKDDFDRRHGINRYATPRVGQGITISTETDMPGFSTVGDPRDTWNFHYAAAVLESGDDYVTLANAAGWAVRNWIWYMYGPEQKGQSFHEEQLHTGTHGTRATSFVVQPERLLDSVVGRNGATLKAGDVSVQLQAGTRVRVLTRLSAGTELRVRVMSGAHVHKTGIVATRDLE